MKILGLEVKDTSSDLPDFTYMVMSRVLNVPHESKIIPMKMASIFDAIIATVYT